jgi:uncharacterized protein
MGRFSIFPHQTDFFALFEQTAHILVGAGQVLVDGVEHPDTLGAQVQRLKDLEHSADELTHQVMAELNRTFVTPIERGDIADLARALDDVVDFMEAALTRMHLFKLYTPSPLAQELARISLQQAEVINRAMPHLRDQARRGEISDDLVEIHRLENAGDRLLEQALATLYEPTPDLPGIIDRLKWREVYELLEMATDGGEAVANALEGIVLQNA